MSCIRMAPPIDSEERDRHGDGPTLRKSQKLTSSFSLRSASSQRMVASEPVIERLGPRSTPISTALRDQPLSVSGLQSAAGNQAERQIVHKVVADRRRRSRSPGAESRGKALRPMQSSAGQFQRADALDGIDHDEQAGNQRQGCPS